MWWKKVNHEYVIFGNWPSHIYQLLLDTTTAQARLHSSPSWCSLSSAAVFVLNWPDMKKLSSFMLCPSRIHLTADRAINTSQYIAQVRQHVTYDHSGVLQCGVRQQTNPYFLCMLLEWRVQQVQAGHAFPFRERLVPPLKRSMYALRQLDFVSLKGEEWLFSGVDVLYVFEYVSNHTRFWENGIDEHNLDWARKRLFSKRSQSSTVLSFKNLALNALSSWQRCRFCILRHFTILFKLSCCVLRGSTSLLTNRSIPVSLSPWRDCMLFMIS